MSDMNNKLSKISKTNKFNEFTAEISYINFFWCSVIVGWICSLLPGIFLFSFSDSLLIVMIFWYIYDPSRIGLVTAFLFGILEDIYKVNLLGEKAFFYILNLYLVELFRIRFLRFGLLIQILYLFSILSFSKLISWILAICLYSYERNFQWFYGIFLPTIILWSLLRYIHHKKISLTEL
ncbi:MAG: rod shape-determining protein MreD [Bordetella sp.]|nr:MAG: rod shape-determining protein MreD [Bordetella sp.]